MGPDACVVGALALPMLAVRVAARRLHGSRQSFSRQELLQDNSCAGIDQGVTIQNLMWLRLGSDLHMCYRRFKWSLGGYAQELHADETVRCYGAI